jgi:hypothetical protein
MTQILEADTDHNGRLTERHVAKCHIPGGELTLCDRYIKYAIHLGTAAGAPDCLRCEQLDC